MSSERDYHSHFIFQKIEVMITQWEKIILGAGKDLETITKDTDRDNFLDAKQAQKYGLVDKIFSKR